MREYVPQPALPVLGQRLYEVGHYEILAFIYEGEERGAAILRQVGAAHAGGTHLDYQQCSQKLHHIFPHLLRNRGQNNLAVQHQIPKVDCGFSLINNVGNPFIRQKCLHTGDRRLGR